MPCTLPTASIPSKQDRSSDQLLLDKSKTRDCDLQVCLQKSSSSLQLFGAICHLTSTLLTLSPRFKTCSRRITFDWHIVTFNNLLRDCFCSQNSSFNCWHQNIHLIIIPGSNCRGRHSYWHRLNDLGTGVLELFKTLRTHDSHTFTLSTYLNYLLT